MQSSEGEWKRHFDSLPNDTLIHLITNASIREKHVDLVRTILHGRGISDLEISKRGDKIQEDYLEKERKRDPDKQKVQSIIFWCNFHFVCMVIATLLTLTLTVSAFLDLGESGHWPAYGYLVLVFLWLSGAFAVWFLRKYSELFKLVPK